MFAHIWLQQWKNFLKYYGPVLVPWSTCPLDMAPIEHALDDFGRAIIKQGQSTSNSAWISPSLTKIFQWYTIKAEIRNRFNLIS